MKHFASIFAFLVLAVLIGTAQPRVSKVQICVVPDHSNALYRVGEEVSMRLFVLDCGTAVDGGTVKIEVSEDLMAPHLTKTVSLKGNEAKINVGTMRQAGFLRVKASMEYEGKTYSALSTVGFDTEQLQPTVALPDDFESFWSAQVEAVRKVDLQPMMELLPERCTPEVDVYHISYANINRTRMYGILTMPKAPGKYPAVLRLPGAGVGEKGGDIVHAAQGLIVLELGIHGMPVNLDSKTYSALSMGALASYPTYNVDNKYSYYYKRVYVGCARGVDFLLSLPQCNGRVGTLGGSQGGALSIAVSAIDKRVCATAVYFPALCDMEGYMHGRAGGWPHLLKSEDNRSAEKIETLRYYDTSNFARKLTAPVVYAYGYNDITCAPTTTCATYNVIAAPKSLSVGENIGHWLYPEQTAWLWGELIELLNR